MSKKRTKKKAEQSRGWFTRQDVASFLDITLQQFERRYQQHLAPADVRRDRNRIMVRGRAVVDLYAQSLAERNSEDDPLLDGRSTPALERYREAKAKLAELELSKGLQQNIPRELIRTSFGNVSSILRRCGETLQRQYGREALNILNEALDECDAAVGNGIFGDYDHGD